MRNILSPFVTVLGLEFSAIVAFAVVTIFVAITLLADVAYAARDPHVRLGGPR
jgi:ABC-type dipeptide/oligopeptide/nickel transport system permease component